MASPWVFVVMIPTGTIRLAMPGDLRLWVRDRHSRGLVGMLVDAAWSSGRAASGRFIFIIYSLCTYVILAAAP